MGPPARGLTFTGLQKIGRNIRLWVRGGKFTRVTRTPVGKRSIRGERKEMTRIQDKGRFSLIESISRNPRKQQGGYRSAEEEMTECGKKGSQLKVKGYEPRRGERAKGASVSPPERFGKGSLIYKVQDRWHGKRTPGKEWGNGATT